MDMKKSTAHPIRKIARRGFALCLTLMALWMVWLTADVPSFNYLGQTLGQSADFVTAALALELGDHAESSDPLSGLDHWQMLLLGQSVRLQAGVSSVAGASDKQTSTASDETDLSAASQSGSSSTSQGGEDETEATPQNSASSANIVAKTILPTTTEGYAYADGVYIKNYTDYALDVDALSKQTLSLDLSQGTPQVLIIHTHTTESYAMDGSDVYQESSTGRTLDKNYSVVRVGNEVADVFTQLGISVIHDTEYYDYPNYNGSYTRSAAAIESYLKQYPSIKIIIDLHRDALVDSNGTIYKTVTTIDGVSTAQVDLILGTDANGQSHPNWRQNLALAIKVQESMNNLYPTLARPISLCKSRYNQSYTNGAFLVEIGTHGNTLQEAIAGARLFARAAAQVLLTLK